MTSKSSISFRHRKDADQVYTLPVRVRPATLQRDLATILVKHRDDGSVLIIAGNIPGATWYFQESDDSQDPDDGPLSDQEFSAKLVEWGLGFLSEYEPETSHSRSHSGNKHMKDIYVTVDESDRDDVVVDMWRMLNEQRERYIQRLRQSEEHDFIEAESLEYEVLDLSKGLNSRPEV